jgi:predicted amidohydrolase
MSDNHRLTVGLAQMAPTLGDRQKNLAAHRGWIDRARAADVELLVFPELSLTGYFLKDLVPDVALARDGPELDELAALSRDLDLVVGAVLEEPDHRYFNASLYLSEGELKHIHRKVYLPTYGMFDEQRYLAAGDRFRGFPTRYGRAGILICEDIWHLSTAYILSLQGTDLVICPSASPGRGISTDERLGTAESYELLCRTYAQFCTTFFLYCNRVGYEDGANFWGGSMIIGPNGDIIRREEDADEALVTATLDLADVRRERVTSPLLRDEKLELTINELRRVWHERTREPY